MTNQTYDMAIVGGGMVGMSLAIALARQGVRVAIIERSALGAQLEPSFDGRVSAIALGSKRLLHGIGAWAAMEAQAQPIYDIRVSDGAAPFFLHYDHQEVGEAPFGYIVENRYIRHALHQAASQLPNLTLHENSSVTGFVADDAGITATIHHPPSTIHASLLIGADGKQSQIRRMAGIEAIEWGYEQTAIVCTIAHERAHQGLAQERFLPAGPFAVLPMTSLPNRGRVRVGAGLGDINFGAQQECPPPSLPPIGGGVHRSSLVWVEPNDRVGAYLELPDDELAQEITERVGSYLGEIKLAGPRFTYPLSLMHAKNYTADRLALIGDAAHAIHPIAGQGVNLGFRDVAVLSELIGDAFKAGRDIGADDVLAHYQRWRRFDNVAMLAATDGLNRLFSNDLVPIRLARGLGLWAVGKMPPLKKFFMRHAMGLVGDVPELMREDI